MIKCPVDMSFVDHDGDGSVTVSYTLPNATDDSSDVTVTCDQESGTSFTVGTHTVICIAFDAFGNTDTCTFTITVYAGVMITCPEDIEIVDEDGDGSSVITYTIPTINEDTANATVSCDPPSGSSVGVGSHTITCEAIDISGSSDTCTFVVTIYELPEITCPVEMEIVDEDGNNDVVVIYTIDTNANSADTTVTCNFPSGSSFAVGSHTIECTAVDSFGNTATCTFNVIIYALPEITCPFDMELVDVNEDGNEVVTYELPTPNNGSAAATVTCDIPSESPLSVGEHTITCTITDAFNNSAECNFTVTVYAPPDISCPEDMEFVADSADGQVSVIYTTPSPNANTADASVTCDKPSGTPLGVGTHIITCTITDAFGNEDTCNFTVTIYAPPDISCPEDMTFVADSADGQVSVIYTTPSPNANTADASVTCDKPSGTPLGVGTHIITCTITDAFGNEDTCNFTVIVCPPPEISCPDDLEFVADAADGQVYVTYTPPTPSQDKPGTKVTCDIPSGTLLGVGTYNITCIITDAFGNEDTCSFTVIVVNAPPDISCPKDMEFVADSADGQVSVIYTTPSPNANTANASVTCDKPSGTPLGVGTHIITCTITDAFGNEDTCNFTVTIYAPPDISCPEDMTFVAASADGQVSVIYTTPSPNANTADASVTCPPPEISCPDDLEFVADAADGQVYVTYTPQRQVKTNQVLK
ncbi:hyalin-like [Ptychodera flava]|uniref:hyalin-like n=1 Tax=Ptychodera flava TaxID=63121 RepID=UPI00396A2647